MSSDVSSDLIKVQVDPDSVTTSEPNGKNEGGSPMPATNQQSDAKPFALPPYVEMAHPISGKIAHAYYRQHVGVIGHRFFAREASIWWDRLIAASTPEEKLTCERMIRAAHMAGGLSQWERGQKLAAENIAIRDRESEARSEEADLDRWR